MGSRVLFSHHPSASDDGCGELAYGRSYDVDEHDELLRGRVADARSGAAVNNSGGRAP